MSTESQSKRDMDHDEEVLEEEHGALRGIMSWIEAELERELRADEEVGVPPLVGPLRAFREHLERHFEFEERSGVLSATLLLLPNGSERLTQWKNSHRGLLARLDGVLHGIDRLSLEGAERAAGLAKLAEGLHGLFAELKGHDAFENQLLGIKRSEEFRHRQGEFER